ncbi:TonB-dependent receptor [Rhizorhabdus wittichii DC-6]|nr:TonB-dependent receptor [Rhizorhabdus wittichii DC-6]
MALSSLLAAPLSARPVRIDIPAADLGDALFALSRQTGLSVGMAGAIPRHRTRPISGTIEPAAALERLLRGSGLRAVRAAGLWRLERLPREVTRSGFVGPTEAIEDIIVTGTKRDENLASVPIAVSLMRPGIADRLLYGRGLHDMIETGEGAFATNLGPGRDRIFLRGVADSAFNGPTQSTVSLLLDDARVSYATPDPDLRLVDIDHVELLRGPQGTLYGTGALGGIIRIVPNKPDLADGSGFAAIDAGVTRHGAASGAIEGGINVPLVRDRLAIRMVGYAERIGGWIDDAGRGERNVNRTARYGGRLALRWQATPDWMVDLGGAIQGINSDDSQYAARGLVRSTALAEPHDNDFVALTATVRGVVGAFDFVSASAFVHHEVESVFDAGAVAAARGLPAPLGFSDMRRLRLGTQEWRLSDPAATRPWVLGLALLKADNIYLGRFFAPGGGALQDISLHDDAIEAALFGEASQPLGGALTATLGLRGFYSKVDNEQQGQTRRRARKAGVTPSATLSWAPRDGALAWLRYASAIRPGGLNPDGAPDLADFRSDDLKSVELGWRLLLWRRVRLNGTLFGLRWENIQSDSIGTDGLVRTINAGKGRNIGLELGGSVDLSPWSIDAHLTVQHARLYAPSAAANAAGDDNRLPVLPDRAGRVKIGYDRVIAGIPAGLFVAARYMGKARLSFDPGLARSMGGYWTADAGLVVAPADWRVALTVSNLFDGRGDSFGFGNPFSLRQFDQHTPVRPRTVSIRIERKF